MLKTPLLSINTLLTETEREGEGGGVRQQTNIKKKNIVREYTLHKLYG